MDLHECSWQRKCRYLPLLLNPKIISRFRCIDSRHEAKSFTKHANTLILVSVFAVSDLQPKMLNPSNKGNSSSSSRRSPSSYPQRPASPTNETQTVVDVNDPSTAIDLTTSGNIAVGGGVVVSAIYATCPLCNKTFSSLKALHGHMRVHPEDDRRGLRRRRALPPSSSRPLGGASSSQGT